MELEIRSKVVNKELFEKKLNQLPQLKVKKRSEREVDTYMCQPGSDGKEIIFRIRRRKSGTMFTVKTAGGSNKKDVFWKDIDMPLDDPDLLEDILMSNGWKYSVIIDKVRDSFNYNEFEINFDVIRDLGTFVEIEFQTKDESDMDLTLEKMKEILEFLGCKQEDIIQKGYVKLMLEKINNSVS